MKALLLAAALIGGTPAPTPQPQWIPHPYNTAWEVYGYKRADGSIVQYGQPRAVQPKAPATANYGVQLSAQDSAVGQSVMGPDREAAKLVFKSSAEEEAGCDRDGCETDRPPKLLDKLEEWALPDLHPALWMGIGLVGLILAGLIMVGIVLLCVYLFPSPSTRKSP